MIVPTIEESISKTSLKNYADVDDRYYEHFYWCPGLKKKVAQDDIMNHIKSSDDRSYTNGDQVVMVHSNRVCLVSLAPSHPVVKDQLQIDRLDFDFGDKARGQNRLDNKVSGKGKKGGQGVDERSVLCFIECTDKSGEKVRFPVRSLMKGKLIEINECVVKDPSLIQSAPTSNGHIGLILPKLPDGLAELKSRLISKQEYQNYIASNEIDA